MSLPTAGCYVKRYTEHKSGREGSHYGSHAMMFEIPYVVTIWFSYVTPIAYRTAKKPDVIIMRQNDWGPTTRSHIDAIRYNLKQYETVVEIPGDAFERRLEGVMDLFSDAVEEISKKPHLRPMRLKGEKRSILGA